MNLKTLLIVLRRRWYLVLVGLAVTVGLATVAVVAVSPTFSATSSILLLPPKAAIGNRENPYLNLGGLGPAVDVLGKRLLASEEAQQLDEDYPDSTIRAETDIISPAPVLVITVESPTEQTALQLRGTLTGLVAPTLSAMQTELRVKKSAQITMSLITSDEKPEISHRSQVRALLVAVVLGVVITLLGTATIDGLLVRRRRRSEPSHSARAKSEPKSRAARSAGPSAGANLSDVADADASPGTAANEPAASLRAHAERASRTAAAELPDAKNGHDAGPDTSKNTKRQEAARAL